MEKKQFHVREGFYVAELGSFGPKDWGEAVCSGEDVVLTLRRFVDTNLVDLIPEAPDKYGRWDFAQDEGIKLTLNRIAIAQDSYDSAFPIGINAQIQRIDCEDSRSALSRLCSGNFPKSCSLRYDPKSGIAILDWVSHRILKVFDEPEIALEIIFDIPDEYSFDDQEEQDRKEFLHSLMSRTKSPF